MTIGEQSTQPYYPFWPYYGYYDLGPVQIPPLPVGFGLTDTVTGQILYPAIDPSQGNRLGLFTSRQAAGPTIVYPPNQGPAIGSLGYILILKNGRLVLRDQQPYVGPMPLLPVVGTTQYGAVLTVINTKTITNPKFPSIFAPSGDNSQDGGDHLDFYFAALRGPINRCNAYSLSGPPGQQNNAQQALCGDPNPCS